MYVIGIVFLCKKKLYFFSEFIKISSSKFHNQFQLEIFNVECNCYYLNIQGNGLCSSPNLLKF